MRLRIGPVTALHWSVRAPGIPKARNIVVSSAEERPRLNDDAGGMGITSPGAGDDPEKIVAARGDEFRAAEAALLFDLAIASSLLRPKDRAQNLARIGEAAGPRAAFCR